MNTITHTIPLRIPGLVLFLIISLNVQACSDGKEKKVSLSGTWKFSLGDNEKYARPEYDDSEWEKVYVPSSWEDEGFEHYDGYAWYRKTFEVEFEPGENLYAELGRIDDADQVYINGNLIGGTGGFPPDFFTAYNVRRAYPIPAEYLKNGARNVIAVRIYDERGEGGIMGSNIGIYSYGSYSKSSLNLFGNWKFHLFDNAEWSKADFDDSDWENIVVPSSWENQGFREYDGFAWYRKTFSIPDNYNTNDQVIILGRVDDMDEVFINGKYIDGTGNIDRKWADNGEWEKYRTYQIPDNVLKPGRNTIAVRVYDQQGRGGIYEGPITLLPAGEYKQFWKEYRNDNYDIVQWFSYYFD